MVLASTNGEVPGAGQIGRAYRELRGWSQRSLPRRNARHARISTCWRVANRPASIVSSPSVLMERRVKLPGPDRRAAEEGKLAEFITPDLCVIGASLGGFTAVA